MVDLAVRAAAVVLWVTAGLQWLRARRQPPGDPSRWLALTLFAVAATATLFTESANRALSEATNWPNIAEPLARSALLVATWSGPVLLRSVVSPGDVRHRAHRLAVPVGAAGVVLWSMYLIAPEGSALRSLRRDVPADRWLTVYLAASLVALTIALAESGANARRYAKESAGPLREGLRLLALGCALGLCYVVIKVGTTTAATF